MTVRTGVALALVCAVQGTQLLRSRQSSAFLPTAQRYAPKLVLTVDRSDYGLDDQMILGVAVANVGTQDVWLLRPFEWGFGGLELTILDDAGRAHPSGVGGNLPSIPPTATDLIHLQPHEYFGITAILRIRDLLNSPGHYSLRATYTSNGHRQLFDAKTQKLAIVWAENGAITSNQASISIRAEK
jgi:hypothetical protein